MAFVKEFREFEDEMPEWEYFNSLGIRTIHMKPLFKYTADMVLDRERNFYLVPQGNTGTAYQDENISYYTLILDGLKIGLKVIDAWCNDVSLQYVENHWYFREINIIDSEIKEKYSLDEILEIIKEAFIAESMYEPEITKKRGIIEINFDGIKVIGYDI